MEHLQSKHSLRRHSLASIKKQRTSNVNKISANFKAYKSISFT